MKKPTQRWIIAAGACAITGAVGLLLTANVAKAVPAPEPRFIEGNVTTCDEAGLSGEVLFGEGDSYPPPPQPSGTGTVNETGQFLDVTINSGFTASGIVVKGGPNTNVYDGPFVGPTTIEDMRSPDNEAGNIPEISHWFVCGTTTPPTPSPTPSPTMSPTPSPTPSPTMSPTPSPTMSPTPSPTPSPTKSPTPSPTPSPTKSPTPSPTPSPTMSPTPSPTPSPTMSPTKPTPAPTKVPIGPVDAGAGGNGPGTGWLLIGVALLIAAPLAGRLAWRRR